MVSVCQGQTDTIFTVDNEKIACDFEEIAGSNVIYRLASEDTIRSIDIKDVHKLVLDEGDATVYFEESERKKDKKIKDKRNHTVYVSTDGDKTLVEKRNKTIEIDGSNIRVIKDNRIVEIKVR